MNDLPPRWKPKSSAVEEPQQERKIRDFLLHPVLWVVAFGVMLIGGIIVEADNNLHSPGTTKTIGFEYESMEVTADGTIYATGQSIYRFGDSFTTSDEERFAVSPGVEIRIGAIYELEIGHWRAGEWSGFNPTIQAVNREVDCFCFNLT